MMEKEYVISELIRFSEIKDFKKEYLYFFKDYYEQAKIAYSNLCEKCIEYEKIDLPYDCLSNPIYCVKNRNDLKIITLYEELENE
ncbi:hypothetical protein J8J42_02580 [Chryseobacterium sp. cx-311]|uniref:hypothetical protein n=1 Tax=Marnyiella aurantia TaxID=2758037 RepID=UPI001AE4E68A|nr:hypothetical protein [Marnyiella aurantia]MBP0611930.1 hypothetical protein [Marnyiella aurantia]